ncbi:MAG: hypothetical protein EHM58_11960 [Ignavibacteriae bacterium]|nr:MAG: hypothetical protein EHM58_11960 [Ignavibacteriota bacterium]
MKILSLLILYLVFFSLSSFAQVPHTAINVKLSNDGRYITGQSLKEYKINLLRINKDNVQSEEQFNINDDTTQYEYSRNIIYSEEIYEMTIVHPDDTMTVRFQLNLNLLPGPDSNKKNKYLFFAAFLFDIPFQKGQYEITDFKELDSGNSFAQADDYNWIPINPNNRKLKAKQ